MHSIMTEKTAYKIDGLDCAEEVAVLKRRLGSQPGVRDLDFDVLNARMSVVYDPHEISPEDIVSAVAQTGMKATPWHQRGQKPTGSLWQRHGRLIMACISAAFIAAGFLSHSMLHGGLVHAMLPGETEAHRLPMLSMLLFGAAAVAGGWFVFPRALQAARRLSPDMNLLMTIAVIGAAGIGDWFEAATVAWLFSVALLMEHWSVVRARRAVEALLDLTPPTARYVCPTDGDILEKPVAQVPIGARMLVRPGERIPLDGQVLAGDSTVNQAPITGESIPVAKQPGDEVYAGTINEDGALEVTVTKLANDTTLARIIHLVQDAQWRRAPSERWVETFARYYTPLMLILAVLFAVVPPLAMSGEWTHWLYRALVVLVIACPCALVISTPVSFVSALTAAARNGVLIKGGRFLEAAGRVRAIAMDKTGTLTHGRPEVQRIIPLNGHTAEELLQRAAALESHSDHPLARAVLRRAEADGVTIRRAEGFQTLRGKGAQAILDGRPFWIGSHRLMHEQGGETPEVHAAAVAMEDAGHSVLIIGNDQHVCGLISVADSMRGHAPQTMRELKSLGIRQTVMLTGDNAETARAIAAEAGVDEFHSDLLPEDKVRVVEAMVRRYGQVAMVGDGVNDAPAMATASFGVAMGAMGADAAIETADIALMSDDLSKLPWLIRHSRRTLRIIQQNIVFALAVKALFLSLAVAGLATLWMAVAADMGASLLVISNSLRLLRQT